MSQAAVPSTLLPPGPIPPFRWVVTEQRVIVRSEDVGEDEAVSVCPEGLTFAKNGDLLLAACCPGKKTVILRSDDRGVTWSEAGSFAHPIPEPFKEVAYDFVTEKPFAFNEGMTALRSGRLVTIFYVLDEEREVSSKGDPYYIADGCHSRVTRSRSFQCGMCSGDEGRTWREAPMDIAPFLSADFEASSQIFELKDGTLGASFRGHVGQKDMDAGVGSVGVIRSHDGGHSWGDVSVIVKGEPGSGLWFNESQVIPLPDGRWLCTVRVNDLNVHPKSPLVMCRCYSEDQGRTWSYPVRTRFHGGEPGLGVLPDGAILCMQTGGWAIDQVICEDGTRIRRAGNIEGVKKLLYEISYDGGLTWAYWGDLYAAEPGSGEHIGSPIVRPLDDKTALAVYHRGSKALSDKYERYGPCLIGASWLRKVDADAPEAKGLRYPED